MHNENCTHFPCHTGLLLKKKIAPRGSKFFPLREVPIFKRNEIDEIHSHLSSLPRICITISAFWPRCYVFI